MTTFNDFGLAEPILRALTQEKYITPTPIQAQAIPIVLGGHDLIGIAQTGTGKTAAFALPILNRLAANAKRPERKSCRVLVLSPTRELSAQILDSFRTYGRQLRLTTALAIGGVKMGPQVRALANGVDVFVATPGRLLDLMRSNAVRLDQVEVLVLDEADRMLDMGFIHDIRTIVGKLPAQRQTLLFSATMPQEINELAAKFLRNPKTVAVTPVATTVEKVDQRVIHVERANKLPRLVELLTSEPVERALVFARTKHGADKIVRGLCKAGISAHAMHGNKSQNQRTRVLADFRSGRIMTLVATDIAARGIDVDGISHVFNFDLPDVPESYVHRIGRTARAGAQGIAIALCAGDEVGLLRAIERIIRMTIPATGTAPQPSAAHHRPNNQGQHAQRNRGNGIKHPRGRDHNGRDGHQGAQHRGRNAEPNHGRHPQRAGDHASQPREARSGQGEQRASGDLGNVPFMHRKKDERRGGRAGNRPDAR